MTDKPTQVRASKKWRWVWIFVSLAFLATVLVILSEAENTADVSRTEPPQAAPVVTVQEVSFKEVNATISAYAELRPHWDADIRSAVSGRILEVYDEALAGARVQKGARLFSIEKTQFQTTVASAELSLENARLALLRAQNSMAVALRQFERDGTKPPTDLAIHLPQVRIAERTVASAKAQLQAAQRELENTEITAPFSGFVTKRSASLGQTVNAGETLVHLSDDRQFELMVELSQADWELLDHPIAGKTAEVFHRDGRLLGQARIRQGGGFLDKATRQVRVFLEVHNPSETMLAGDFLKVVFHGRSISNTLAIPEAALSRAGYVWMVDRKNQLRRFRPDILFRTENTISVFPPQGSGPWNIVKTPLASFLPGQRVTPIGVRAEL